VFRFILTRPESPRIIRSIYDSVCLLGVENCQCPVEAIGSARRGDVYETGSQSGVEGLSSVH